jgi:hypothetical protein
MKLIDRVYGDYVAIRRTRVFSDHLVKIISNRFLMLDVGCGDGLVVCSTDRFILLLDLSFNILSGIGIA